MNKNYPFFVWILTLIIGPLLWILVETVFNNQKAGSMFEVLPVFIIMGMLFSLPVLLISILVYTGLRKKAVSTINIKFTLILTGILGVTLTFYLIGGTLAIPITISYSIAMAISYFIIPLKPEYIEPLKRNQQKE